MLSTKTKEHLRRWAARVLPRYAALLGGAVLLTGMALWVGGITRVVTVTDSRGARATVVTAAQDLHDILRQAGITPAGENDEILFTTRSGSANAMHIVRTYVVPVTADGTVSEVLLTHTSTVAEALQQAGVELGPDDQVSPALDGTVPEGGGITVTRIQYREYTVQEAIPRQTVTAATSLLYRHTDRELTAWEGCDGLDAVTYREIWTDGVLTGTEEVRRETMQPMSAAVVKTYGEGTPVSRFEGPDIVDGQPCEGVAEVFTSQRATGYSASPTAKGASGRRLTYGTVAVNPNVIPYGSLMYITSDDGRFVYGYAYAADTGTAMMTGHAFIDLYYECYDESVENAVIPVTVYLLDEETAARYQEVNDALLEADTTPGV